MSELKRQYKLDKKIEWVFFDLDNTLWDFDKNADKALHVLYQRHNLNLHSSYQVDQFIQLYKDVNASYWRRYELGQIDKETLRTARFTDTFNIMGIQPALHPVDVWNEYLEICPLMTNLLPGALDCLSKLSQVFQIGILTNGFEMTQNVKIRESGISKYIQFMQTSESVKLAKPSADFFQQALDRNGLKAYNCVYIGDNEKTDVWGGINAGITTFHFKYNETQNEPIDHLLFGGVVVDLVEWADWLVANQSKYDRN